MRILHLDSGREMRGGQWQALRLIEALRAAGHEAPLLARSGSPLFARAAAGPLSAPAVWRASAHCTLVHVHDARSHTLAALAARSPFVVSRRVAFPIGSRWKYGRAARFLAVSGHVAEVLRSGGVPDDRIDVVYDAVPLLPLAVAGEYALIPASDDPRKGTALAKAACAAAGVPSLVSSNLETDLSRARLLVYLTESEGLGSAALLAQSAGVPVVASRVGGLPEAVAGDETGLLVENREDEVAGAVAALWKDGERLRRFAAAARLRIEERFTVDHLLARTLQSYRKAMAI